MMIVYGARLGFVALLALSLACTDEPCRLNTDCAPGLLCDSDGQCIPPDTLPSVDARPRSDASLGPDAAADAGEAADTGAVDAGVLDAGSDLDAAPMDTAPSPDGGFDPVRLRFPPGAPVVTSTDAIVVRGEISALGAIREVEVNGIAAASTDGFATFSCEIPLALGPNDLEVRYVEDGVSKQARVGRVERQSVLLLTPTALAAHGDRLYLVDSAFDHLLEIDPQTEARVIVSGSGVGSGPGFVNPEGLVMITSGTVAYVLDRSRDAVMQVDLPSGARRIFSREGEAGTGQRFVDPRGIALDEANQRLLVVDSNLDALFVVDLLTGDRRVVSDDDTGGGRTFSTPRAVLWDAARGRALVADTGRDMVFGVDLDSGDRTELLGGSGPSLPEPVAMAFAADGDAVWVADLGVDALLRVDLPTGQRRVVARADLGAGPWFEPRSVAVHTSGLYVLDNTRDGLVRVDATTGDRVSVAASVTVEGNHPGTPYGVAVHPTDPTAPILFADNYFDRIIALDPRTGAREVLISGPDIAGPYGLEYDLESREVLFVDTSLDALLAVHVNSGAARYVSDEVLAGGALFSSPRDVARAEDGRLFVVDDGVDTIFSVDPRTGARTVVGGPNSGTGVALDQPYAVDTRGDTLFVADSGADVVMQVDLQTGARTPLPGADADLSTPRGLVLSPDSSTLYVSDSTRDFVIAVDLETGERATLSSASVGRGPRLVSPVHLTVHPDEYLVVVDNSDAIVAVDLYTGDRVYLSK